MAQGRIFTRFDFSAHHTVLIFKFGHDCIMGSFPFPHKSKKKPLILHNHSAQLMNLSWNQMSTMTARTPLQLHSKEDTWMEIFLNISTDYILMLRYYCWLSSRTCMWTRNSLVMTLTFMFHFVRVFLLAPFILNQIDSMFSYLNNVRLMLRTT